MGPIFHHLRPDGHGGVAELMVARVDVRGLLQRLAGRILSIVGVLECPFFQLKPGPGI